MRGCHSADIPLVVGPPSCGPLWRWRVSGLGMVWCLVVGGAAWTGGAIAGAQEAVSLPEVLPDHIELIELISTEGQPTQVTVHRAVPVPEPERKRVRLSTERARENLLAAGSEVGAEGACAAERTADGEGPHIRLRATGRGPCRLGLAMARGNMALDVLSGSALQLRGAGFSAQALTLTDRHGRQTTVELPAQSVPGPPSVEIPLAPFAREVDVRDIVAMTLGLTLTGEPATLDAIDLVGGLHERASLGVGFWVWEFAEAARNPEGIISACLAQGCRRLLIQMPASGDPDSEWERYADLLARVQAAGLDAYALDGAPEFVRHPAPLVATLRRLAAFTGASPPRGIQLDLEPYLLKDFAEQADGYQQYLAVVRAIKAMVDPRTRLSIVMPFWFATVRVDRRPVAFAVMDVVDEVAVMSYRTDPDELQAIADDTLRYGDLAGTPVWLAVETRALPEEHHLQLQRVAARGLATAYVERAARRLILAPPPSGERGEWFRVVRRYTVRSERLSYSGQSQAAVRQVVATLLGRVSNRSFAGLLIHDLTGFRLLQPGAALQRE